MSYIGRGIDQIDNISTLDNLSFNGSDATFNLTQNSVAFVPVSADALQIQIDGVIQSGNYTVSGSTVTFDFTPSGSSVCNGIKHFGVGVMTSVSDGAVTNVKLGADSVNGSKIADSSISDEHLDNTAITGQTAITSLADTDKFLVSDASDSGNLKYVEKQYLPSGDLVRLYSLADNTSSVTNITIDNVFSADYDDYLVLGDLTSADNAQNLRYKFRDGSGDRADSEYDHRMLFATTGDSAGTQHSISATGQDYGRLTDSSNNDNIRVAARIALHIFNPYSASRRASITMTNRHLSSGADVGYTFGVNDYKNDTQLTGIKFYWASGNVSQSRINIYGYKKA